MQLVKSNKFGRDYVKIFKGNPSIGLKIDNVLRKLEINPFDPTLKTHKLKGKFEGIWSSKVTNDIRIIFEILQDEKEELVIHLLAVGKHDEVY